MGDVPGAGRRNDATQLLECGLIWISVDGGSTWEPQVDYDSVLGNIRSETRHAFTRSVTLFEGKFIVVGAYTTGGPSEYHAAVWIGEWDE